MKKLFIPTIEVKNIEAIDFLSLYEAGYENIILDVDNTIVPWNEHIATPELIRQIRYIQEMGFKICLLSNNNDRLRVTALAKELGVLAVPMGAKPFPRGFRCALRKLNAKVSNTIVIGDQIFTDVLGGNIMGMVTILVNPISEREFFTTRLMRVLEGLIMGRNIKNEVK